MLLAKTLLIFGIAGPAEEPDFNRDIRPILAEYCFHCHGPDSESRKAGLRLDLEEFAHADNDGVRAVAPGDPSHSELIARILTDDPDDIMPPPESKRKLTKRQKGLLLQWVEAGGKYEKHWAYVSPAKPEIPKQAHPVDHLLNPQITSSGLTANKEADRRTLIRRVSLDLTGLPPDPEEVAAFLADKSPDAYDKVVTRLLASPRFGEKWARSWLDLARYADSNGFQADQLRDSWAYRDWVIDALNTNKPFDQFTIEQLAGDLLPNATAAQKIATGFHRTVTCNVEAGVDPEENRVNQVVDRVNTTGTVWLGTTLECAQCHDHKYDPFSMEDYYGIFAYFNNTPLEVDNGGSGVSFDFIGPKMEIPLEKSQQDQLETIRAELKARQDQLKSITTTSAEERKLWEENVKEAAGQEPNWIILRPDKITSTGGEDLTLLEDGSILATGRTPDTTTYTFEVSTELDGIRQFKVEALTHPKILGSGPGRGDAERSNFILSEFTVTSQTKDQKTPKKIGLGNAQADFSQQKWEVAKAIDGDGKTGWAIAPQFGKPHWATFTTINPVKAGKDTTLRFTLDQNYGRGRVLGCVRISASTSDPSLDVPADIAKIVRKPTAKRTKAEKTKLDAFYAKSNPAVSKAKAEIAQLEKQLNAIKPPTTLVMVEMDQPRDTHIMKRGNYLDPAQKVTAATPAALHAPDLGKQKNRLGFAKWLVSRENPLTARVTINRWWAELFGQGIVGTLEDFGTQSAPPTHPELLDWLASEFIDSGWSMKHMLELIVTSDAYKRSSFISPEQLEKDPKNILYTRGPRFRMPAEMVRDNALKISGLLSTKMHGKPIMPYQPPGLWRQVGRNEPKWVDARNEDRFRRGIYVVYRRAAPYPSFTNFDAPDRSACVVDRPRTNTPLQALTLLNDPAYSEMALALAARILTESKATPEARIETAFEIVLSRKPSKAESQYLKSVLSERRAIESNNPEAQAAAVKAASGVYKPPSALKPADLSAWYHVATILLNLDETITKG